LKVNISQLKRYEHETKESPFSVKLVLEGEEAYWINGKKYILQRDQFLIVDRHSTVQFEIQCNSMAKGICFYPPIELISSIVHSNETQTEKLLGHPNFQHSALRFTEKVYHLHETATGKIISQYYASLKQLHQGRMQLDWDRFMVLFCESLVKDQLKVDQLLAALPSKKKSTREELYRRVSTAKAMLEAQYREPIDLDKVSEESMLSKYHFVRSFKTIFGVSPIQYLLQLRLAEAKKLRVQGHSYNEIAHQVGFSDARNLRKAMVGVV
jgi:AraC-like DNA-binding protein